MNSMGHRGDAPARAKVCEPARHDEWKATACSETFYADEAKQLLNPRVCRSMPPQC